MVFKKAHGAFIAPQLLLRRAGMLPERVDGGQPVQADEPPLAPDDRRP